MARIAITGGTGFVGIHTTKALLRAGHQVRLIARGSNRPPRIEGVEVAKADVVSGRGLEKALEGCDALVHLVAVIRERGGQTFERVNAEGTRRAVEAAGAAGLRHLVHLSALGADPDPDYPYLATKWQGEQHVRGGIVPHTIVRSSLLFGPGDGFFTQLAKIVRLPAPIPVVGDGKALFQPLAIADMGRIMVDCVDRGLNGGSGGADATVEVGGPQHLTYEDIIDIIRRELGYSGFPRVKVHVPVPAMLPLAFLMDRVLPHPPVTPAQLKLLEKHNITRLDAVPAAFGFAPQAFADNCEYLQDY